MRYLLTSSQVLMEQATTWAEFMERLGNFQIIETTSIFTFGLVLISLRLRLPRDYICISISLMGASKRWSLRC